MFFNVRDARDFFGILERTLAAYKSTHAKRVEDLLLMVLGFAHLREWIAPGFRSDQTPTNLAEAFASELFKNPDYLVVLQLANHAKHQRRQAMPKPQVSSYVEQYDDRDIPIDDWLDHDTGPASAYRYGERNLLDVFDSLLKFYRKGWFSLPPEERLRRPL